MTHDCYIDQILNPIVLPWLVEKQDFLLEEDGDSGHGFGKGTNKVKQWKERHGLKVYQNCAGSPDITPIENSFQVPKEHIRKFTNNNIEGLRELSIEGWAKLKQETINKRVDEMPQRLQDIIDSKGKMTGH
jgi:hypothetical protein